MLGNDKRYGGKLGSDPCEECSDGHSSGRYYPSVLHDPIQVLGFQGGDLYQIRSNVRKEVVQRVQICQNDDPSLRF